MLGSTLLEVALGVMFVFLLLSLLCSALSELIESFLKFRATDLKNGIGKLLSDPGLAKEFFNHPLIVSLGEKPSYIPARTFSLALWNMATTNVAEGKQATAVVTQDLNAIRGLIDALDNQKYRHIKVSLLTLIDEAGNDLSKARANIEEWYNDAMERVSGGYKRRTYQLLIVIGLFAAAILNVDTINVARVIWYNDTLRASVATAAEAYLKANPTPTPVMLAAQQESPAPGAATRPSPTPPPTPTAVPKQSEGDENPLGKVSAIRGEINKLGLPIGWILAPEKTDKKYAGLEEPELTEQYNKDFAAYRVDPRRPPQDLSNWLLKALGIFLTALAVSQGAPFWFDLLNKFIVIRSTVKPREKSPEQPSKDKPVPETAKAQPEKKDEQEGNQ